MINTSPGMVNRLKLYSGILLFVIGGIFAAIPLIICLAGFFLAGAIDTHDTEY